MKMRYFLKAEQNMCYFRPEKNSEYIYKELKEHDKINDACEFLKKFKNTSEIYKSYEKEIKMNDIQSFECNEHHWTDITRAMRTCQKHEIESDYIDIDNKDMIVLYDSKSAVSYINLNYKFRLKAFKEIKVVKKNDENIITVFKYDDLSSMIFWRKRNSANYLIISTTHSIKLNLNILKEDDDLKEKKLRSYISIRSIHIMKIILYDRKVITVIYKRHKESYITRIL